MADLGTPAAGSATPNPAAGGGAGSSASKQTMIYICGGKLHNKVYLSCAHLALVSPLMLFVSVECHSENEIKPSNPIRCTECGYRIMYKKRTKRSILASMATLHG